jgi:lysophospholipase L1-like esterase
MGSSSRGGAGGAGASGGNAGNSGRPREDGGNLPDIERDAGPFLVGGSNAGGGGTSGGSAGRGGGSGAGGAGKWQIMALGDSVTGTTCYPKLLSKVLIDRGHDNFELVGTVLNNQSCGNDVANVQTEGHGGYLVTYLTSDNDKSQDKGSLTELLSWAAEKPQVVLMEYGTNDCWTSSIPLSDITSAFGFVVDRFRAERPDVIFFVAQITPLNPSGCSTCETRVEGLNALIPTWADSKSTAASPVYVVDVWSSLPAASYKPNSTYTSDGAHPNVAGSQLMADVWADALIARGIP